MSDPEERTSESTAIDAGRRRLLRAAGAVPLVATPIGASAAARANANPASPHVLKLASSWPSDMPVFGESMALFADTVQRLTGGAARVEIVTPAEHGRPLGAFDLARSGKYDIAHTPSYYHIAAEPDALFLTTMPFGMTAAELAAFLRHGGGLQLVDEVYSRHGLEAVPGGNTGMQMGGWFTRRIDSVDDLEGLRMRIPGPGGRILRKFGVESVTLPADALYDALSSGELDAVEFVGPSIDLGLGLHRVAPYYYTGWHEPGPEMYFLFNAARLAALPAWLAETLRAAGELTGARITSGFHHANAEAWARVKLDYPDIHVTSFPAEVVDALRLAHEELTHEEMARSAFARKAIGAMSGYIRSARRWTEIGDWSYLANT